MSGPSVAFLSFAFVLRWCGFELQVILGHWRGIGLLVSTKKGPCGPLGSSGLLIVQLGVEGVVSETDPSERTLATAWVALVSAATVNVVAVPAAVQVPLAPASVTLCAWDASCPVI